MNQAQAADAYRSGPVEVLEPEELRRRAQVRVLRRLIPLRGVSIPVLLGFDLWIALTDDAPWRRLLMGVIAAVLASLILHDLLVTARLRRGQLEGIEKLTPNLVLVSVMQHVVVFATGGMASPVVPVLLLPAVLTALFSAPRLAWRVVVVVHLAALWLTTSVQLSGLVELTPAALAWPDGTSGQAPITTVIIAVLMSFATVIATLFATVIADSLNQTITEALRARDSALAARTQQAQELTTLSGEIAHELKNPLASVKGLAALVSRELERASGEADGVASRKSAERMQVLRREVDRMQAILDEFLNFSRPLVPLDQREVELRELVAHVVDLHEGVAAERRVSLRARGQARVVCDPRKVEQILINVVQNALEVAPSGSEVEIELALERAAGLEQARVEVRDRGPGLAASVRARVFEPGVTAKPGGSGLGLTIARALARQHGGELELDDRPAGGCAAILTLPRRASEPPAEQP